VEDADTGIAVGAARWPSGPRCGRPHGPLSVTPASRSTTLDTG
jgi:hypothetical protein